MVYYNGCVKSYITWRGGRDGLRRSIGNAVYVNSVPWVRIPSSPPEKATCFDKSLFNVLILHLYYFGLPKFVISVTVIGQFYNNL